MISSCLVSDIIVRGSVKGAKSDEEALQGFKDTLSTLGFTQEIEQAGMFIASHEVNHVKGIVMQNPEIRQVSLIFGH